MTNFNRTDLEIIVYALNAPAGVPKALRLAAQQLQDRIKFSLCRPTNPRPSTTFFPIRSPWPDNPAGKVPKGSSFGPIESKKKIVPLPKATKPSPTVDSILQGLI